MLQTSRETSAARNPMKIPLLILSILAMCTLVLFIGGKRGLFFTLGFAGTLLLKDAVAHFWGKLAEWILTGAFVVIAIVIYLRRQRKRRRTHVDGANRQ